MQHDGSLRVRPIYLPYWTIGCLMIGILVAPLVLRSPAEDHATHLTHEHAKPHDAIEVDPANAPEISISVVKDAVAGWNVFVTVESFTFVAESVNQVNAPNQGHAHLYVDGEKVTRLYGTAYHLADLSPGRHAVTVGLNANDHSDLVVDGERISATVSIEQPSTARR